MANARTATGTQLVADLSAGGIPAGTKVSDLRESTDSNGPNVF